jgi:hypothetical protein
MATGIKHTPEEILELGHPSLLKKSDTITETFLPGKITNSK